MRHLPIWWPELCLATWLNYVLNSHTSSHPNVLSQDIEDTFFKAVLQAPAPIKRQWAWSGVRGGEFEPGGLAAFTAGEGPTADCRDQELMKARKVSTMW